MNDPTTRTLLREARARIFWGEAPSDVAEWLQASGLTDVDADTAIAAFMEERASAVRDLGWHDIVLGGLLTFLCFATIGGLGSFLKRTDRSFGVALVVIGYGAWRLHRGVERLRKGAAYPGSLSDT